MIRASSFRLALMLMMLAAAGTASADVSVNGTLEPDAVEVGDSAILTISVDGAGSIDGDPRVNAPDGVSVRSGGESRSFSMVNGRISKSVQIQYVVLPLRPGSFTIGPVEVHAGGRAFTIGPYHLTATQGGGPPPAASSPGRSSPGLPGSPGQPGANDQEESRAGGTPPVFVDMRAEPAEVTVGQQTVLIVRFWQRADVTVLNAQFVPPETEGFWKEDLTPERHTQAARGGTPYEVTEIRLALFPTRAGDLTVSPARVQVQYREPGRDRSDPFSFFGFGGKERQGEPTSNPVTVHARPIPQPAPASFTGAVGHYSIDASTDRGDAAQGEPITWTVTIKGEGNISTVTGPSFPDIPGCRGLDGGSSAKETHDNDVIGGEKTFSRILIPESAGNLELPSLAWTAFDPADGKFVSMSVPARRIAVAPASSAAADDGSRARIGSAIRGIRGEGRLRPSSGERPWTQVGFWLLQIVPVGAVAAAFVVQRRRTRLERDPEGARMRQAPRKLRAALAGVASERTDPWGALVRAVDGFLADRYGSEVRGMTRSGLREYLIEAGSDPSVAADLSSILESADTRRYTPGTGGEGEGITQAVARIADLAARLKGGAHG